MKDEIIVKYIVDEASAAERREVETWISESEENRKKYDQMLALWQKSENLETAHQFNTDAAWNKVQGKMSKPAKQLWISKYWVPLSAAAALILVAVLFINRNYTAEKMISAVAKDSLRTLALSDGSTVTLKEGVLEYPDQFKGSKRRIKLRGRAFFEIHRDTNKPFEIITGIDDETRITVLGTSFEVISEGDEVVVKVRDGKVKFSSPGGEQILSKGEQAIYSHAENKMGKKAYGDPNSYAYATKTLDFYETQMANVAVILEKHYGKKVLLRSGMLYNCEITATFKNESLENVLDVIAATLDLKVEAKDGYYILTGQGCKGGFRVGP